MEENNKNSTYMHYTLVAGTVLFSDKRTDNIGAVPVNGMFQSDRIEYNRASLAYINKVCSDAFKQSIPDEELEHLVVRGVNITNLMYLGYMTPEEFQREPLGVIATERKNDQG